MTAIDALATLLRSTVRRDIHGREPDRCNRIAEILFARYESEPPVTQRVLADRYGVSVSRLGQLEYEGLRMLGRSSMRPPRPEIMERLAPYPRLREAVGARYHGAVV